jgi:uncharacterized membrane protein
VDPKANDATMNTPGGHPGTSPMHGVSPELPDPVDLAGEESFPASDPPSWAANRGAEGSGRGPLLDMAIKLEQIDSAPLEAAQRLLDESAGLLPGSARSFFRGDWLGHALHPPLTDLPLGCWLGAGILDLFGGERARPAARTLVGWGLLTSAPTAAAGVAEWGQLSPEMRRVGAAHASGNVMVIACYAGSWLFRRAGSRRAGVLLGLAGGLLAMVTGYLGGHMSFGRRVGTGIRGGGAKTTG